MKKYELKLKENESLEYDIDDLMEKAIVEFHKKIKDIKEEDVIQFRNWLKIYKTLNYDTIESVKVTDVYRINKSSAIIQLSFKGKIEYDFLMLNADEMVVRVITIRGDKLRKTVVRRLLIPQTAEEALMFAKSDITKETLNEVFELFNKIKEEPNKYNVTKKLSSYLNIEVKEEPKKEEQPKEKVKEEPKKEEQPKKEHAEECKEEKQSKFKSFMKNKFKFKRKEDNKEESVVIDLEKDNLEEIEKKMEYILNKQEERTAQILKDAFGDFMK